MHNSITGTVFATAILLSPQLLLSWGPSRAFEPEEAETPPPQVEVVQKTPQWFADVSLLLWLPYEDQTEYADWYSQKVKNGIHLAIKLKKPHFQLNPGVRGVLGMYVPNHEEWDFSMGVTYFSGSASAKASAPTDEERYLVDTWIPSTQDIRTTSDATVHWGLNFFVFDLTLGRETLASRKFKAHPYLGVRGVVSYEAMRSSSSGLDTSGTIDVSNRLRFRGKSNYAGVGPRLGSDFTFVLGKSWGLIGNLSGALFFGNYKVHESIKTLVLTDFSDKRRFRGVDHGFAVRSNLEGSLGIRWETWSQNQKLKFSPSLMFEASEWFDMNQWIGIIVPRGPSEDGALIEFDRRHGDLGFVGCTLNLQVDY